MLEDRLYSLAQELEEAAKRAEPYLLNNNTAGTLFNYFGGRIRRSRRGLWSSRVSFSLCLGSRHWT
jgi:hypothetical protein